MPSSSGRGDASRTSRSPSWIGLLARISQAQQVLPLGEGLLRVRVRPARARPGGQVAVPVLDRHRHAGELVQRLGDPRLALPGDRHPGEPVMDFHAALQTGDRLGERGVRGSQFGCGGALPGVQSGIRHGDARLLGDDLDEEPLLGGRLQVARRDQVPEQAADAAQRVRPGPAAPGQVHFAAALAQCGELPGDVADTDAAGGGSGGAPLAIAESVALDLRRPEPGRRGGRQLQDLVLADRFVHQQQDHQERAELG